MSKERPGSLNLSSGQSVPKIQMDGQKVRRNTWTARLSFLHSDQLILIRASVPRVARCNHHSRGLRPLVRKATRVPPSRCRLNSACHHNDSEASSQLRHSAQLIGYLSHVDTSFHAVPWLNKPYETRTSEFGQADSDGAAEANRVQGGPDNIDIW
jgi:hypothetical protein